jgi:hypothetical protein
MITIQFTGNLGNKLFQLWSLAGIGAEQNRQVVFPESDIYQYFEGEFITSHDPRAMTHDTPIKEYRETQFNYGPVIFDTAPLESDISLKGYFQSEKYWLHTEESLRKSFTFKKAFVKETKSKMGKLFDKPVICLSIRRGDFVNNPTYYQLPIRYYIGALLNHFPDFETKYNLLLLSDDLEYCKAHFWCLENVYYGAMLTPMEQLCLGSLAQNHIISNSTFSWWCAYLSKSKKVIRPKHNFGEAYRAKNPEIDYWPTSKKWIVFEHEGYKIPLQDTTFMIPVYYDHPERKQNLDLSVCMIQRDFDTNIIVMENKANKFAYMNQWTRYVPVQFQHFHRTRMLNQMALLSKTELLFNWDADVIIPPLQVWKTVELLRSGKQDFVYPYDGRFVRVLRRPFFKMVSQALDIGILQNRNDFSYDIVKGKPMAESSVGGAVGMVRKAFIVSGMENEHMVSYAPEDCERWDRWHRLGFKVFRVPGKLYHIDHYCGPDSCSNNPFFKKNHAELDRMRAMPQTEFEEYVHGWPWRQRAIETVTAPIVEQ